MNEQEATTLLDRLGRQVPVGVVDVEQVVRRGRRRLRTRRIVQAVGCSAAVSAMVIGGLALRPGDHSSQSATLFPDPFVGQAAPTATQHRLLHLAEVAATANGGTVKVAEAVRSTHATAERLVSGAGVPGNQPVWVIQVEGVHPFVCDGCSHPAGANPPTGRFLTLDLDARTFQTLDVGLGPVAHDLSRLGTVIHLRG